MLLAVDIGNTNITVGLFRGEKLFAQGRMPTHPLRRYQVPFLKRYLVPRIEAVIVSSVVPKATVSLKRALNNLGLPRPFVLGEEIQAPVINRYRIPSQVGQDRLVNGVAALHLYGGPAIVVDFGTAITIDLISRRREYLGGVIVPGVEIALEALVSKAALLPRIKLAPTRQLLGRDTVSSMRSGILFGYSALCDGIVRQLKSQYAPRAKVIATGGYVNLIVPRCRTIKIVNRHLTLQGLALIYENRDASRSVPIC